MLRLDLWDYSDEYILVNGRITVEGDNNDKTRNKKLILKKKMLHLGHVYQTSIANL